MGTSYRQLAVFARLGLAALAALAIVTPAAAQFSRLKKKVQAAAAPETTAPGAQPGMIVLTDEVMGQLITGLKAGQAERAAAARENTPYGRYKKAEAAYAAAKPKCEAGQQTFPQRAAANQKMLDKYSALTEKMVAAQEKGDLKLMTIYQDSAMAMQDPSCVVKQPEQPEGYYEAQREMDVRAEKQEAKASGFGLGELAMVKERAIAILQGATPPGDASPAEKAAVSAKAAELKPLLGFVEQPAPEVAKPTPAPATAAAAAPDPAVSAAASNMSACITKNLQTHQTKIEALAKRAEAAQKAQDSPKLMAIADTMQQLQMSGCMGR